MSKHIKRTGLRGKYEEIKALPWTPRARMIGDILTTLWVLAGIVAYVAAASVVINHP